MKPSLMHSKGSWKRMEKFSVMSPARKAPACLGVSSPVVRGRALVRSTCLSMSRSVKSLMMQPALLQERAPTVNKPRVYKLGIKVGLPKAKPQ